MEKTQRFALGYLPRFHQMLRLLRQVTLQHHQILRLPREVTLQHQPRFQKARILRDFLQIDSSGSQLPLFSASLTFSYLYSQLLLLSATLPSATLPSATLPSALCPQLLYLSYSYFQLPYNTLLSATLPYFTLSYSTLSYSYSQLLFCVGEQKFVERKISK